LYSLYRPAWHGPAAAGGFKDSEITIWNLATPYTSIEGFFIIESFDIEGFFDME
jgi:hypothetical protein